MNLPGNPTELCISLLHSTWAWRNIQRDTSGGQTKSSGHQVLSEWPLVFTRNISLQLVELLELLRLQTDYKLVLSCHRHGTGGPTKVGYFDMFLRSDFLILPFHRCSFFTFNFQFWLTSLLPKQITELNGETDGWVLLPAQSQGAYLHTTQLDWSQNQYHIISDSVDRIGWWSFLAFIIFCTRDGPNQRVVLKKWLQMKALNPYHGVCLLLFQQQGHFPYQAPAWDGKWQEMMWNELNLAVVPQIWQSSHNIFLTNYSELRCVRESFVHNPQWHPPKTQQ